MSFPPTFTPGSVPGVAAAYAGPVPVQAGAFSPGQEARYGTMPTPASRNSGVRYSEVPVVHSYVTKEWRDTKFHHKQAPHMCLFNVRSSGRHNEVVPMVTPNQLNHVFRTIYEAERRLGRLESGVMTDREQVDELLQQLREGGELFLLGSSERSSRISDVTRRRALQYTTQEGIWELWNFLGVYQNDSGREMKNAYNLNVCVQGPVRVHNVFHEVVESRDGNFQLGRPIHDGDYCHYVLKRRLTAQGEGAEFQVVPLASQERSVEMAERYYVDSEGYDAWGPTWFVGQIKDVYDKTPDARTVVRMRGLSNTWEDAYEAHGVNESRVQIACGALASAMHEC